MTHEEYTELMWKYQFGPERVLQNIFAVDDNVEVLMTYARARGQRCRFWTFTFKDVEDLERCVADWGTFLRRLRAKTGVCGLRVFEWGRTTGRFHVHAVFDRFIDKGLVDRLKADLETMGHSKISKKAADENLGRYLWKELTKQFRYRRALGRRRLWATFGRLAGFVGANDIVIKSYTWVNGVMVEWDFWKECKRLAWETRVTGESRRKTWERAGWLYSHVPLSWHYPREHASEELRRWLAEHGDAYEDAGGGDMSFDPEE